MRMYSYKVINSYDKIYEFIVGDIYKVKYKDENGKTRLNDGRLKKIENGHMLFDMSSLYDSFLELIPLNSLIEVGKCIEGKWAYIRIED